MHPVSYTIIILDSDLILQLEVLIVGAEDHNTLNKTKNCGNIGPAEQNAQNTCAGLAQVELVNTQTTKQDAQNAGYHLILNGPAAVDCGVAGAVLRLYKLRGHVLGLYILRLGCHVLRLGCYVLRLLRLCRCLNRHNCTTILTVSGTGGNGCATLRTQIFHDFSPLFYKDIYEKNHSISMCIFQHLFYFFQIDIPTPLC